MTLGVLADVHANLQALEAALRFFDEQGVDGLLCAGDLVGYGPDPVACIDRLRGSGAVCVLGNHDLMVLGRLSEDGCTNPYAPAALALARAEVLGDRRAWLDALPLEARAGDVVVTHGALGDPERYVRGEDEARRQLGALAQHAPGAAVLVVGHTHRPLLVGGRSGEAGRPGGPVAPVPGEPWLLNPGSVGQARGEWRARARVALLDLDRREVTFAAVPYDTGACRRRLRRAGLSATACHLRPIGARHARAVPRAVLRPLRAGRRQAPSRG